MSGRDELIISCFFLQEGAIAYNTDRSTPPPYECSTPSSELDRASQCDGGGGRDVGPGAENALLASLLPNMAQQMQSVQLMPSGWCFISFMTERKQRVWVSDTRNHLRGWLEQGDFTSALYHS